VQEVCVGIMHSPVLIDELLWPGSSRLNYLSQVWLPIRFVHLGHRSQQATACSSLVVATASLVDLSASDCRRLTYGSAFYNR